METGGQAQTINLEEANENRDEKLECSDANTEQLAPLYCRWVYLELSFWSHSDQNCKSDLYLPTFG